MHRWQRFGARTYPDVIFQFYAPGRIKLNFFERLTNHVIWQVFSLLGSLDRSGFVQVSSVVHIESLEGIREREDLILRQLRKFPAIQTCQPIFDSLHSKLLLLELEDIHFDPVLSHLRLIGVLCLVDRRNDPAGEPCRRSSRKVRSNICG